MPKILITGNGFDLNLGLPTSYNDFINILSFVEKNQIFHFDSLYSNSSNYKLIIEKFKAFEFDKQNTEILRRSILHNQWFQFFKNEYEIETWIDFENKIEYVLKNLFVSVDYIKDSLFSKGSLQESQIHYNSKLFNNNIEIMQVLNKFEIISLSKDFEITLNVKFLVKKYGFFIDIDLDKITKHLISELNEFKKIFNYYFETFVIPLYANSKTKNFQIFQNINKHYTFNYTPTFNKIYGNQTVTNFLHGKISSGENKIVLGINEIPDNEKINKKYFLPFTKYYQKFDSNTDFVFIKEFEKKQTANFQFFFWGHSLDKSDEDYINEIFEFIISLKSTIKKIIIIYHNDEAKSKLLLNVLNIRGKKDIYEMMRSNMLVFLQIDSVELKKELSRDISNSSTIR